jgi:hypothetical protein
MDVQIDLLTVFVAAVLNMVIGFLWYSKWLFGPAWTRHAKTKMGSATAAHMLYGFVVSLVIAYFLGFFEAYLGVTSVTDGMFVGFCAWLGFVATTQVSGCIWNEKPIRLFFVDTGFKLFSFLVMSGIIGA